MKYLTQFSQLEILMNYYILLTCIYFDIGKVLDSIIGNCDNLEI